MIRERAAAAGERAAAWRWLPALLLLLGLGLVLVLGLDDYLGFAALREHRARLLAQVDRHLGPSILVFLLVYATAVALSVPGAAALTITGGFLFGQALGAALSVAAASAGAVLVFLAARTAIGDGLRRRAGPWLGRLEKGFRANAFSYLLALRLIPAFPFFVVNLVPAMLGVRLRTFALATAIGIVPGAFVYASVGAGLGTVFDAGAEVSLASVLTVETVTGLVGLALLALLPAAYRRLRGRPVDPAAGGDP